MANQGIFTRKVSPTALLPEVIGAFNALVDEFNRPIDSLKFAAGTDNLGYSEATSQQTSISTEADLTSLSTTVSIPASFRRVLIIGYIPATFFSNSGSALLIRIKEGSTQLNSMQIIQNASTELGGIVMWSGVPSPGLHTYKLTAQLNIGTGTGAIDASSTNRAFIMVNAL